MSLNYGRKSFTWRRIGAGTSALFCIVIITTVVACHESPREGKAKELSTSAEAVRDSCADDIEKFCNAGAVIETIPRCLSEHRASLSIECEEALRKAQRRRD